MADWNTSSTVFYNGCHIANELLAYINFIESASKTNNGNRRFRVVAQVVWNSLWHSHAVLSDATRLQTGNTVYVMSTHETRTRTLRLIPLDYSLELGFYTLGSKQNNINMNKHILEHTNNWNHRTFNQLLCRCK